MPPAVSIVLRSNCYGIRVISSHLHCLPQVLIPLICCAELLFFLDSVLGLGSSVFENFCCFDGTVVFLRKNGDSDGEWRQWPLRVSVDRLTNWVIFSIFILFCLEAMEYLKILKS